MTCIVGIIDDGIVHMGADSAGSDSYYMVTRKDTKVFKNGEFLIGYTTSFRMGQLLRFKFKPPEFKDGMDVYEYMVTDFVDSVRECLKDGGFSKKKDEVEIGGTFLVGFKGRLLRIESDYQVGESALDYDSCGCGQEFALGSLYSTQKMKQHKRLEMALSAAQEFSTGVRGPFNYDSI